MNAETVDARNALALRRKAVAVGGEGVESWDAPLVPLTQ